MPLPPPLADKFTDLAKIAQGFEYWGDYFLGDGRDDPRMPSRDDAIATVQLLALANLDMYAEICRLRRENIRLRAEGN